MGVALPVITGNSLLCNGTKYNFSATNWNGYTWSSSSNVNIFSSSGNTAVVQGTNTSGQGWVSVMSGLVEVVRFNVWVNTPIISEIIGPSSVPVGNGGAYSTSINYYLNGNISSYEWEIMPSYNTYLGYTNGDAMANFYSEGYYRLSCRAKNTCGTGSWKDFYIYAYDYSPSPPYPNPVSDVLNIEIGQSSSANAKGASLIFDVRLVDGLGTLLRQTFTKGGTVQFNLANLPDGIYFLHIYDGVNSKPVMKQIVVEH